jgi:hypothetical protein
MGLTAAAAHFLTILSSAAASTGGFITWGLYARARVSFKAAHFRAPRKRGLCSSAPRGGAPAGQSFERAALARGPRSPTKPREVHGFKLKSKGHHHEQVN